MRTSPPRFCCLLLFALGLAACGDAAERRVDGAEAARLVRERGAQLLDVRTPGEFASGHPAPAQNIPVDDLADRLASLDPERPVVVYCSAGVRSARAASLLTARGYEVYDMRTVGAWAGE